MIHFKQNSQSFVIKHCLQNNPDFYLDRSNTSCLKGFFALIVTLGHIREHLDVLNDTIIGQILTASGYLSVSVFFFLSGYGLLFSYKQKGKAYLSHFIAQRIIPFYCQYIFIVVIYCLFYVAIGDEESLKLARLITTFTLGGTIVQNGWYIQTILVFYFVFWATFLLSEKIDHGILVVIVCMMVYCGICILAGWGPYSYVSVFSFPLGMLWCSNKKQLDMFFTSRQNAIIGYIVVFFLFCITLLLGNYPVFPRGYMLLIRCASAVFFAILTILTLMKVRISYAVLKFAGKNSFELYAFHGIFLLLFKHYLSVWGAVPYTVAVLFGSLAFAAVVHPVMQKISLYAKKHTI